MEFNWEWGDEEEFKKANKKYSYSPLYHDWRQYNRIQLSEEIKQKLKIEKYKTKYLKIILKKSGLCFEILRPQFKRYDTDCDYVGSYLIHFYVGYSKENKPIEKYKFLPQVISEFLCENDLFHLSIPGYQLGEDLLYVKKEIESLFQNEPYEFNFVKKEFTLEDILDLLSFESHCLSSLAEFDKDHANINTK